MASTDTETRPGLHEMVSTGSAICFRPTHHTRESYAGATTRTPTAVLIYLASGCITKHRSIRLSTFGIMFMGTPYQGGNGVQLG
ncbi:hypothetical protein PG994_000882 [Apiospora phragmitis]|uniref:Uncharacterized protein n=1 Tax=Apiospora phragmitis TaxID=2905665 RepID=A0ABR1WSC6_9PEZI